MMGEAEASRAFDLDSPFWRFALRVYAEPGVSPLCLALQDENGVDVNLLLFACWCGSTGRSLTMQHVETAAAATVAWTEGVVRHLRAARRAWKLFGPDEPQAWAGRETLKLVELLSERIVCATLYGMADRFGIVREAEGAAPPCDQGESRCGLPACRRFRRAASKRSRVCSSKLAAPQADQPAARATVNGFSGTDRPRWSRRVVPS